MIDQFKKYNYSRQFVLFENEDKKIYKKLNSEQDVLNIDDYLWKIVTTVTQREVDGRTYHKLQYEDKVLGWVELESSIQIFRNAPAHFRIKEDEFINNEINLKLGIEKDFISHFKGRLLNVKSEVHYKGERYYSVFIKNKFHGFHHESLMDPLIECDIILDTNTEFIFHRISNLTKPVEVSEIEAVRLVAVFKHNNVGKVLANGDDFYCVALDHLTEDILQQITDLDDNVGKTEAQLHFDDMIYSVNLERTKTKEMMSTILSAKDFLKGRKGSHHVQNSLVSDEQVKELRVELKQYKEEARKANNELSLAERRLQQQKDYSSRLTEQRDKYKERMTFVEDKLKTLNDKYKSLKEKYDQAKSSVRKRKAK